MTSRKRPRTATPNSSHTALTDRDSDANFRCAIITLHTVLPPRPLHPENSEKALGALSKRVEFRALGAGGIEQMRAGGRGEQMSAPFWSHCTARRREDDTTAWKLGG
eukprot:scaffold23194_cov55-Phaeocystis_antarctica.AAC.1